MAREFYGATVEAQHTINKLLSLPASGREQDWEFELADPSRIEEMLRAMSRDVSGYDEKCALGLLMIASIEESIESVGINRDLIEQVKVILQKDLDVREAMAFYWIEQGRASEDTIVREILLT